MPSQAPADRSIPKEPTGPIDPMIARFFEEMRRQQATYGDVSKRAGVSPRTMQKWRIGRSPRINEFRACAESLGLKISIRNDP